MATTKWGESFLKSGLPLEHIAALELRSLDWSVRSNIEYQRALHKADAPWFELDLFATHPAHNNGCALSILAECKYHDTSRFWMFLPTELPRMGAIDTTILNVGPIQAMRATATTSIRELAPTSSVGVVLSHDGQKQDNAIHTGMQQLANAFAPFVLPEMLGYLAMFDLTSAGESEALATALIPALITNASLFRLRRDVHDLETIRNAKKPDEVADPLSWTWCRFNMPNALFASNERFLQQFITAEQDTFGRFPKVEMRFKHLLQTPRWIAVVNIDALPKFTEALHGAFMSLKFHDVYKLLESADKKKAEESISEIEEGASS